MLNQLKRGRAGQGQTAMITPQVFSSLSEQRILVAGVARNCEKTIQRDVLTLFASLRNCRGLSFLVVESDSSDKTIGALRTLERDLPNFRFISLGSLQQAIPIRTQRIAHCRNVYLEELKSNPLYADIDYVVVADLDGVNDLITPEGFASCWTRSDWDVCTANQRGPYFDIWALRHRLWSPNDCWQQLDFLLAHKVPKEVAFRAAVLTKMITIDEREEWIEVDSAFGGLAVYRRHALDSAQYFGLDKAGDFVCEHVSLNNQIRSHGYRIFINPSLINTVEKSHTRQRLLTHRLKRRYLNLQHGAKEYLLGVLSRTGR